MDILYWGQVLKGISLRGVGNWDEWHVHQAFKAYWPFFAGAWVLDDRSRYVKSRWLPDFVAVRTVERDEVLIAELKVRGSKNKALDQLFDYARSFANKWRANKVPHLRLIGPWRDELLWHHNMPILVWNERNLAACALDNIVPMMECIKNGRKLDCESYSYESLFLKKELALVTTWYQELILTAPGED